MPPNSDETFDCLCLASSNSVPEESLGIKSCFIQFARHGKKGEPWTTEKSRLANELRMEFSRELFNSVKNWLFRQKIETCGSQKIFNIILSFCQINAMCGGQK